MADRVRWHAFHNVAFEDGPFGAGNLDCNAGEVRAGCAIHVSDAVVSNHNVSKNVQGAVAGLGFARSHRLKESRPLEARPIPR